MTNELRLSGIYNLNGKIGPFNGTLTIKENESFIYCTWNLYDEKGKALASKSMPIYLRQILDRQDALTFSQLFAIEGIKQYRIGRERIVVELSIEENTGS